MPTFFCSLNVPPSFRTSSNSSRLDTSSVYLGCSRWCTPLPLSMPVDIQLLPPSPHSFRRFKFSRFRRMLLDILSVPLLHPIRDLLLILRCLADTSRLSSVFFPALSMSPHSFRTTSNSSRLDSLSVSIRVSEEDMAYYPRFVHSGISLRSHRKEPSI